MQKSTDIIYRHLFSAIIFVLTIWSLPVAILIRSIRFIRQCVLEAGFDLQSCNSNCQDLQKRMIEDGGVSFPLRIFEKMLGYYYSPQRDSVRLTPTVIDTKVCTKRSILSQISKIYDPLSLLLPVTIQGKLLINELWENNLS